VGIDHPGVDPSQPGHSFFMWASECVGGVICGRAEPGLIAVGEAHGILIAGLQLPGPGRDWLVTRHDQPPNRVAPAPQKTNVLLSCVRRANGRFDDLVNRDSESLKRPTSTRWLLVDAPLIVCSAERLQMSQSTNRTN
jgi:hypothetical protein